MCVSVVLQTQVIRLFNPPKSPLRPLDSSFFFLLSRRSVSPRLGLGRSSPWSRARGRSDSTRRPPDGLSFSTTEMRRVFGRSSGLDIRLLRRRSRLSSSEMEISPTTAAASSITGDSIVSTGSGSGSYSKGSGGGGGRSSGGGGGGGRETPPSRPPDISCWGDA